MDAEQKKQRAQALYASYQKKAHGIRDKIRGDLDALTQAEEQAKGKIELKRVTTEAQMRAIAGIAQEYGWSPYETKRQQYKVMGMTLPAGERKKDLTPVRRLGELNPTLQVYDKEASRYRLHPKTKRPQMLAPEGEWTGEYATEKDWRDVPPDKMDDFWRFKRDYASLTGEVAALRQAIINRPGTDLLVASRGAMNPIAQSVREAAGQPVPSGEVRVRAPNGATGTIPRSDLSEALAAGYVVMGGQ